MKKNVKLLVCVFALLSVTACTTPTKFYNELPVGKIQGQINLQWRDDPAKSFVYIPNPDNLFSYTTSTGDVITPGPLYTDGGSIPRIVSLDKHFVPWKHGPAYIIHDWLFELNHCGHNDGEKYNHINAAQIMAEVMKTQFVNKGVEPTIRERIAIWEIYGFTKSFSEKLWYSDEAVCEIPPHMEIHTEMIEGVREPNVISPDEAPVEQMDSLTEQEQGVTQTVKDEVEKIGDIIQDSAADLSSHIKSKAVPYSEYLKSLSK